MNDTKITVKEYWNTVKESLSKNKRTFLLLFLLILLSASVFLLVAPMSASIAEKLVMVAPFVLGSIVLVLAMSIILAISLANRRKYGNTIAGKDTSEIASIYFQRQAKASLFIIAFYIWIFLFRAPGHFPKMELFTIVATCMLAFLLFLVIARLFKKKSSKAVAVGYACIVLLIVLILLDCFVLNSRGDFFKLRIFEVFMFVIILTGGVVFIHKASKQGITQKNEKAQ